MGHAIRHKLLFVITHNRGGIIGETQGVQVLTRVVNMETCPFKTCRAGRKNSKR